MERLGKSKALPILLFLVIALNGCASIILGRTQKIPIDSSPSDARFKIEDLRNGKIIHVGKTPFTVTLDRGSGYFKSGRYNVTIEKKGYQPRQFMIEGSWLNGWYLGGNSVFGGLFGWLVLDPITGAMWKLKPREITGYLVANTSMNNGEGLTIALRSEVPEELVGELQPIDVEGLNMK